MSMNRLLSGHNKRMARGVAGKRQGGERNKVTEVEAKWVEDVNE